MEKNTYGKGKLYEDFADIIAEADKKTRRKITNKLRDFNLVYKELEKIQNTPIKEYLINLIRNNFLFHPQYKPPYDQKPYSYYNNIVTTKLKILLHNE